MQRKRRSSCISEFYALNLINGLYYLPLCPIHTCIQACFHTHDYPTILIQGKTMILNNLYQGAGAEAQRPDLEGVTGEQRIRSNYDQIRKQNFISKTRKRETMYK